MQKEKRQKDGEITSRERSKTLGERNKEAESDFHDYSENMTQRNEVGLV